MSTTAQPAVHAPNPIAILIRVVVITLAFAILGLGLGGFFGILGLSVANLAGERVDMILALFAGGVPGAMIGGVLGLVLIVRSERKALRKDATRAAGA